jgi:hypothetical protein
LASFVAGVFAAGVFAAGRKRCFIDTIASVTLAGSMPAMNPGSACTAVLLAARNNPMAKDFFILVILQPACGLGGPPAVRTFGCSSRTAGPLSWLSGFGPGVDTP